MCRTDGRPIPKSIKSLGAFWGNYISDLYFLLTVPKLKIPQRLERQGIPHFSKASDIDHVPIDA
ncbi:MAG: hypothetical protein ACQEXV_24600, partial [Bacillota bacterium]